MTFGVMFHHFHDHGMHRPGQGSISAEAFASLLGYLGRQYNLLSADDYVARVLNGSIGEADTCLSFDDALLCQHDIALPVLNALGLKAFFFVYSSIFTEEPDPLELYRDFRNSCFDGIEAFYSAFFRLLRRRFPEAHDAYRRSYSNDYLAAFEFYSDNDRRFRFVRDQVLPTQDYADLMRAMMRYANYPLAQRREQLWMSRGQVAKIAEHGHEIGLHSHSHPMQIHRLDADLQALEYRTNYRFLSEICGRPPRTMSHPCGHYNADTLKLLPSLGIHVGFRSSMATDGGVSTLEIPREDHAELMKFVA